MIHSIKGIAAIFDADTIILCPSAINPEMYNLFSPVKFFTILYTTSNASDNLTLHSLDWKATRHKCLNPRLVPKSSTSKHSARMSLEGFFLSILLLIFFLRILLLLTDFSFFAMVEIYYSLTCKAGTQINCMLWFQKILIRSPNNTSRDRVTNLHLSRPGRTPGMWDFQL